MKDLEESKSEMADVEYEEMKEDIKEQLKYRSSCNKPS